MHFWKIIGGILLVVIVIGLFRGDDQRSGETPPPSTVSSRTSVAPSASMFGTKYSAAVQTRIDAMAADRDCRGLQAEFDTADANDDATRRRTGSGTADLMGYIDDAMRRVGCYG